MLFRANKAGSELESTAGVTAPGWRRGPRSGFGRGSRRVHGNELQAGVALLPGHAHRSAKACFAWIRVFFFGAVEP